MSMRKRVLLWMLCLLPVFAMTASSARAVEYDLQILENDQGMKTAIIPKSYKISASSSIFGEEALLLTNPADLYVSPDDHVYVADTGNDRILMLDNDLNLMRIYELDGALNKPEGVFADTYGAVYIADTGNNRIVKVDKSGNFVEEFTRPVSELLGEGFTFNARRVAVSSVGYIYALKYQYVMQMDAYNHFRGYIGTTEVGFDLGYNLRYLFSNAQQRQVMARREPASCFSFDVGPDGSIYVTTADRSGELKCINSVGKNIYPKKSSFGFLVRSSENATLMNPQYVDVAVDDQGNVFLLESISGQVSIYNGQGENLCVFGGRGEGREHFQTAVALDVDHQGNVFVLDQKLGCVKKFSPTRFMNLVYSALYLYDQGKYAESEAFWQEILDTHESYALANNGMARLKYKQKDYGEAMRYYEMAGNRKEYSEAFGKYEVAQLRSHFPVIVLISGGTLILLILILILYRRYTRWQMARYSHLV